MQLLWCGRHKDQETVGDCPKKRFRNDGRARLHREVDPRVDGGMEKVASTVLKSAFSSSREMWASRCEESEEEDSCFG